VPAPTERDVEDVADSLGLLDVAAVTTERHRSWIMQSVAELAALGDVGVRLVDEVTPYEQRKLWLLNGPHSAVAYGGLLRGEETIAGAVADPTVAGFVRGLVDDTLEVADLPPALEPAAFAEEALRRFANPALGHRCAQVGADGSSKLPQRLLPVVAARRERALPTARFAVVAAIWIAATAGLAVRGLRLPQLEDPAAGALRAAARREGLQGLSHLALGALVDASFTAEVASALRRLTGEGPALLEAER
jgi:fructuronate reductase